MTFPAQHRPACFRLKRDLIVLAAIVANDLEAFRRLFVRSSLFRTAFRTALWLHHIALVESFLLLLREDEDLFALNTWDLDIRHDVRSFYVVV